MAFFYGWGLTVSRLQPLRGGSCFFRNSRYSFSRPRKDDRLIRSWSNPVVLNTGHLDWASSWFENLSQTLHTKMKFPFKDFSSYSSFLRICSHLLKKSLMENAIFCAMVENTCNFVIIIVNTAQKVSVFEVVLFCIFPYSDWIWSAFSQFELNSNWPYSVRMRENADHNNSEYGHFSHSAILK